MLDGKVLVSKVRVTENPADLMTKLLSLAEIKERFERVNIKMDSRQWGRWGSGWPNMLGSGAFQCVTDFGGFVKIRYGADFGFLNIKMGRSG